MRTGGFNTIQQTLTPDAAAVLGQSIAEATRRNHGQTTPLHVAATLLASPSGFLRQACIRSHPNSSHPLQCRALDLCFGVALDRLPTATAAEPPVSNALLAALKRAQANQRRGTFEQQQPLLAVKVELDQLMVSVLDDPSVSRVMKEAGFSSPAVKASIEQSVACRLTLYPSLNPSFPGIRSRIMSNPGHLVTPFVQNRSRRTQNPAMDNDCCSETNLQFLSRPENSDFCPKCSESYENELTKLAAVEKSFSEARHGGAPPSLPPWLQDANKNDQSQMKTKELHHHCSYSDRSPPRKLIGNLIHPPVLQSLEQAFHLDTGPSCPVKTDLVLGTKVAETAQFTDNGSHADTYKKLLKALMEKAWWQEEAAMAMASAIAQCRLASGRRKGSGLRRDTWLLLAGPDRIAKKMMATVLAEQVCAGSMTTIYLGTNRDSDEPPGRGKTAIDRIVEAVQKNPFSIIMLQDIDEVDALVRRVVNHAMQRGRIADSHGREVVLGNAVFLVTGDWSPESKSIDEKKLAAISGKNCLLRLIIREKTKPSENCWQDDNARPLKLRKAPCSGLRLDLNLKAADKEDKHDGSHNSSNLTNDHEDINDQFITSVPNDLLANVDRAIMFKPVDTGFLLREIRKAICSKFSMTVDNNVELEVEDEVLEKILGGLWHDRTGIGAWIENVLVPGFYRLKTWLPSGDWRAVVVWLVTESGSSCHGGNNDWLPCRMLV